MSKLNAVIPALALVSAAGAALAQPVAQPPVYRGEVKGFDRDAAALPRLVRAAERHGGHVLEARYDGRRGPAWDVVLEQGRQIRFVQMSRPQAGAVVLRTETEPRWMLGWRGRKDATLVEHAGVGLAKAIESAEASDHGAPAVAAGIAVSASDPQVTIPDYNVLLLEPDDHVKRVAVDARTGLVIADPQALAGWPA